MDTATKQDKGILTGRLIAERFRLGRLLGRGGMATVYQAEDLTTQQQVALKIVANHPGVAFQRFEREALVLARLQHPNIVNYIAHGVTEKKNRFIAMEWLKGEDLDEHLFRVGRLSADDTLILARQVALALQVAHDAKINHRDLKPSNIFLVDKRIDKVKLIDFGVAKVQHSGQKVTITGMTLGTPGYMAPEQVKGAKAIDARADIFSLGCVLYECLTGEMAFDGEHSMAVLSKILFDETPRVARILPEIDPSVDGFVQLLMEKIPEARPANGAAVVEEIANLSAHSAADMTQPIMLRDMLALLDQRSVSLLVAGFPTVMDDGAPDDTLPELKVIDLAVVRESLSTHGAQIEGLANGSIAAIFAGDRATQDKIASAIVCSVTLRQQMPEIAIAIATANRDATMRVPIGAAIDRAVQALEFTPVGRIWLDTDSAAVLGDNVAVDRLGSDAYLAI